MKFYYSTGTCSTACHIALAEAGISFEPVEVSWKRKVNVEALEKVNPLGQVPALVTDSGETLIQNVAILEYVADLRPEKHLLPPAGTFERTKAVSWLAFTAADLQKSFSPLIGAARMTSLEAAQNDLRSFSRKNVEKYLSYVEKNLIGKNFLMGGQFTVADAYLFVVLGWCKWAEVKTASYPNVQAYMKRVYDRPAVRQVLEREDLLDYLPN